MKHASSQISTSGVGEHISFMNIHEKRLFLRMEVSSDTELSLTDTKNKGSALQHQETNCVSYNFLITSKRKLLQFPFRIIGVLCTLNEKPGHQIFFEIYTRFPENSSAQGLQFSGH